nr:response regulator transcription factor [uncultured Sulfurimonas sp.]
MKILLLEDELMLSKSIQKYLLSCEYLVDVYDNGEDVLQIVEKQKYDFYILDINTPIVSGLECLKVISSLYPTTPKIIISAYDDIDNISSAFNIGCNDYLKKPFNLKELYIRINNLILVKNKMEEKESSVIDIGENYKFDKSINQLYYKDELQIFTKKEHALMLLLVENIGQIITDENIQSFIWDGNDVESSTIRSLVNRLRLKLKEDILENVRGFGYMMKKLN